MTKTVDPQLREQVLKVLDDFYTGMSVNDVLQELVTDTDPATLDALLGQVHKVFVTSAEDPLEDPDDVPRYRNYAREIGALRKKLRAP